MHWSLWILLGFMALCGFVAWCCVRVAAKSDARQASEDDVTFACECALSAELSDISFAAPTRRTAG
jgi:hypothetical protein